MLKKNNKKERAYPIYPTSNTYIYNFFKSGNNIS